jgi:membrane protease subunit (stomatin/prohibitin family)
MRFLKQEARTSTYSALQEFNDLLWATSMPITVMLGGQLVKVRVRGICSVVVVDIALLQEKIPEAGALPGQVRAILANMVTDIKTR